MISVSEEWRFVAPYKETNYWEETIIQHQITEHRAIRRAFAETICRDSVAVEAIRQQAREAATCNPSSLPRLYQTEENDGVFSIIYEFIEGRTLEEMINHDEFKKPVAWCRWAIRLVKELIELRRNRACFDQIDASQFLVSDCDDIRLSQRSPIGRIDEETAARSPILKRLSQLPRIGVHTGRAVLQDLEMTVMANLLLQMAAASTKVDVESWMARSPRPEYGPEGCISKFVAEIHLGSHRTLDAVLRGLEKLLEEESHRYAREKQAALAAMMPEAASPSAAPTAPPQRRPTSSSRPPMPSVIPPSGALVDSNPFATPEAPASTPARPSSRGPVPAPAPNTGPVEDANPWLADPLAPGSPPVPAATPRDPGTGGIPSGPIPSLAPPPLAKPRRSSGPPWGLIILVSALAIIAVVGYGIYYAVDFFKTVNAPPNQPPVAKVANPTSTQIFEVERVRLDARESFDPDGSPVSFTWEVVSPEGAKAIWTRVNETRGTERTVFNTNDPELILQFVNKGEYTVQLTVRDEFLSSPPIKLEFKVVGRN